MGLVLLVVFLAACSRETRDDVKEFGNDVGRDMDNAANKVQNQAEDALD